MPKKLCDYLIKPNIQNGDNPEIEWNECRRLGPIRLKTCEKCAFNFKNKEMMAKARKYYRVVK